MIGHVGARVSALVDGQLPAAEADRLWSHVHVCGLCQAAVEREGWVKTQLAALDLSCPTPSAPLGLRGNLSHLGRYDVAVAATAGAVGSIAPLHDHDRRRVLTVAAIGAGSIGAAMMGVIALSFPAEAPGVDRRAPTVSLNQPTAPTTPVRTLSPAPSRPLPAALRRP